MIRSEFSERAFEKCFFSELSTHIDFPFSPTQNLEWSLGFDDALLIEPEFLSAFFYLRRQRRRRLFGIGIRELDRQISLLDKLGLGVRFNLFIHYKVPGQLIGTRAAEWNDWKEPYFRYDLTPHQQNALENIAQTSSGRAAAVYASPAFVEQEKLVNAFRTRSLIRQSNICDVERLVGHHRYSYTSQGRIGKGHSTTVNIESRSIEATLDIANSSESMPLSKHLISTDRSLRETLVEDANRDMFQNAFSRWSVDETRPNAAVALLGIYTYVTVFSVDLMMVAGEF